MQFFRQIFIKEIQKWDVYLSDESYLNSLYRYRRILLLKTLNWNKWKLYPTKRGQIYNSKNDINVLLYYIKVMYKYL